MRRLAVLEPGARTTVEDLGRRHSAHAGVPEGGAFDPDALIAANRLAGNRDGDAGLEMTLVGPELRNDGAGEVRFAIAGGAPQATVDGRRVAPGSPAAIAPGERLRVGRLRGARAWLALAGGVDVPPVLGSRSTCTAARFGGHCGRPLVAGDVLRLGEPAPRGRAATAAWRDAVGVVDPECLRILAGPQADLYPGDPLFALEATLWSVGAASDRTGVRLDPVDPSALRRLAGVAGIPPEGTTAGAIQVPADGRPIVLGPDRPVTGGYAKPAVVMRADLAIVARLLPGDRLRFARVALDEALRVERERRAALAEPA